MERLGEDTWPSVRTAAAESLGGRADAVAPLLRALDDPSFGVVVGATSPSSRVAPPSSSRVTSAPSSVVSRAHVGTASR